MSYGNIPCSLEEAFPAALCLDVLAAVQAAPVTEAAGPIAFALRGERLVIPYRVLIDRALFERADGLTPVQREIFFCIFSRHHDGHVRERALRQFIRSPNEWVIPFVVQLMGEYVIEIHRVVRDALPFLDGARYASVLRDNLEFLGRKQQQAASYSSCGETANPAFQVFWHFEALLKGRAVKPRERPMNRSRRPRLRWPAIR